MSWLTVITVVKDDADGFSRSLASLQSQELTDVELVIVDSSGDAAAIPGILASADSLPAHRYTHEPARGIYPAMNSGLSLASGTFVYFLNAGDTFFDADVISRLRAALPTGQTWGFGRVEIAETSGKRVISADWDYESERAVAFSRGFFPPHQGTVAARAALIAAGSFDTDYSIAADYAMALRLSQIADPVVLPFVLATFREGGASTIGWRRSFREFHRARTEILLPRGGAAVRERWETARHFGMVLAAREIRPRLSWRKRR